MTRRILPGGSAMSIFLRGSGADVGTRIALDAADDVWVACTTRIGGFSANLRLPGRRRIVVEFERGRVGAADDVWVAGTTRSADFPQTSGFLGGGEFVVEFNPAGSALGYASRIPHRRRMAVWLLTAAAHAASRFNRATAAIHLRSDFAHTAPSRNRPTRYGDYLVRRYIHWRHRHRDSRSRHGNSTGMPR